MKPELLVLIPLKAEHVALISEHFQIHYVPDMADQAPERLAQYAQVPAMLTNGAIGCSAAQFAVLPKLELVCAIGVGYENIDLEVARQRRIAVANGAGTNDSCVADHAMALLLACIRRVVPGDTHIRQGGWRETLAPLPNVSGKRMGILGLGTIGRQIAKRSLGFDMEIGYHNRRQVEGEAFAYFDSAEELAAWADYLMVVTPGGAATRHLVNAKVLEALGSKGYVVNVARGSVVDTEALAHAVRHGTIAGAGLDVYESEPEPPVPLLDLQNIVLTPHVAGHSPEAIGAAYQRFIDNATRYFAGLPMVSPIAG